MAIKPNAHTPAWKRAAKAWRSRWLGLIGRRRLQRRVREGGPFRIIVGTSGVIQDGWIATDIEYLDLLSPEQWSEFFSPNSISAILAEHVWEHLTPEQG